MDTHPLARLERVAIAILFLVLFAGAFSLRPPVVEAAQQPPTQADQAEVLTEEVVLQEPGAVIPVSGNIASNTT